MPPGKQTRFKPDWTQRFPARALRHPRLLHVWRCVLINRQLEIGNRQSPPFDNRQLEIGNWQSMLYNSPGLGGAFG